MKCEATSFSSLEKPSWVCFPYWGLSLARGPPDHPPLRLSPVSKRRRQLKVNIQAETWKTILVKYFYIEWVDWVVWGDIPTHNITPPPFGPNTCASHMRGDHHPCPTATLPPLGLFPPKHKVQRAIQPPPDHESQMNPRIKDTPLLLYPFSRSLTPLLNWLLCSLPTSWDVNTLCSCLDLPVMLSEMERPPLLD